MNYKLSYLPVNLKVYNCLLMEIVFLQQKNTHDSLVSEVAISKLHLRTVYFQTTMLISRNMMSINFLVYFHSNE